MKRALAVAVVVLSVAGQAWPQPAAPDAEALRALLTEFLAGASRSDPAVHERFWAEELVYTSAAGERRGKAEILRSLRSPSPPSSPAAPSTPAPATTYTAEDVRIQQYGDVAIVAFRLVGATRKDGKADLTRYLNTGTFVKRGGTWRAVAWQATRMGEQAPAAGTR